jgi:hypothetical protein
VGSREVVDKVGENAVQRMAANDGELGFAGREEGAYLDRDATDPAVAGQPPVHFQRNPLGRGEGPVIS